MDESNQMSQQMQHYQQQISSYTGKLLRDHFGKGPESVFVSIGYRFITIYLRNFLTPSERILLEQGHDMIFQETRDKLMQLMIPEITRYIEIVTGNKPQEFYYDWGLHNRSGMFIGICAEPFQGALAAHEDYSGKKEIETEMIRISKKSQKEPTDVYSYEINSRTVIIVRRGILVRIEKELIRLGHAELLKRVKRSLEKSYLHDNSSLESILHRQVSDVFVDWDFEEDKSVITLVLSPKQG